MTVEIIAACILASEVYGREAGIKARKSHGVWWVILPPHDRRSEVAQAFEDAGVTILADIRQG